jgi:hypothetical protein
MCGLEVGGVVGAAVGAWGDVVDDGRVVGIGERLAAQVTVRVFGDQPLTQLAVSAVPWDRRLRVCGAAVAAGDREATDEALAPGHGSSHGTDRVWSVLSSGDDEGDMSNESEMPALPYEGRSPVVVESEKAWARLEPSGTRQAR